MRLSYRSLSIKCVFLLGITVAACTRPAEELPPDKLSTMVASTLTAAPTLPPSATPPPSATAIPIPSSTPTETATQGPTATPPPPELPLDDPRYGLNIAAPQYFDDFSSHLTWFGPNFDGAVNVWDEDRMRATDNLADLNIWWSTTIRDVDAGNLYAEVAAEIGDCAGKDGYGFSVRVSGELRNSGYTLEFSCDGNYRIRKFSAGSVQTLVGWTASEAILVAPNSINRMAILADGNTLHAFANGELLTQTEDSDFTFGTFGLFASAVDTPGLTVYFDNFSLWYLTP
jgi:hypothetical protein